jgi:gamma-glutamyl phosphate reductase
MSKAREVHNMGDLIPMQQTGEVTVLPPNCGVIGRFLEQTANMFKARAMRMNGLLKRVDETGQRMEALLRMAAKRAEEAESALEQNLLKEGLLSEISTKDPDVE